MLKQAEAMHSAQHPVSRIATVLLPRHHDSCVTAIFGAQFLNGYQISFQVTAGYTEARLEVSVLPNTLIQTQSGNNLVPVRTDVLTDFGERVSSSHRRDEKTIDSDLAKF